MLAKFLTWFFGQFKKESPLSTGSFQYPQKVAEDMDPRISYEVILYSFYLKLVGCPQELNFGDWYYVKEDGVVKVRIYNKTKEQWDFGDFESLSANEFVRMVSRDEAENVLKELGYTPVMGQGYIPTESYYTVSYINDLVGHLFAVSGTSKHAAYLRAAYTALVTAKNTVEHNNAILKSNLIKIRAVSEKEAEDNDETAGENKV